MVTWTFALPQASSADESVSQPPKLRRDRTCGVGSGASRNGRMSFGCHLAVSGRQRAVVRGSVLANSYACLGNDEVEDLRLPSELEHLRVAEVIAVDLPGERPMAPDDEVMQVRAHFDVRPLA